MPRILTAEDTRLSDIQKSEIEVTNSILELIKGVDENVLENADKPKLMAALLGRVSNDDDIMDALNIHKLAKPEEPEKEANEEGTEGESDDFEFNM
jgi:hypothetical protein